KTVFPEKPEFPEKAGTTELQESLKTSAHPGPAAIPEPSEKSASPEISGRREISGTGWLRTVRIETSRGRLELTRGSFNIGIHASGNDGEQSDALFSVLKGGLVSFRRSGTSRSGGERHQGGTAGRSGGELFEKMPRPCFWRAPTSNDAGNFMAARHGFWKTADAYLIPRPDTLRIFTDADSVLLRMAYALPVPFLPAAPVESTGCDCGNVNVDYRFFADGRLVMRMDWAPVPGLRLPPMPLFGFAFTMSADYDRFLFYGNGPAENYVDRNRGARLGIHQSTVKENLSPYLVPQECGNRTGVRWAEVTDGAGRGLRFTAGAPVQESLYAAASDPGANLPVPAAADAQAEEGAVTMPAAVPLTTPVIRDAQAEEGPARVPERPVMEFSALPCTAHELENASHPCELPPAHYTNVRCALAQMGIGGDDSWGAQTLPQYCLPADRPLHFEVTVEAV
ncbi:MAG: hypothetical protein Q4D81_14075, partial [Eubacteriales bacterium]|nr:hypothetical protein [Eubacteriales bacterium]